MSTKRLLSSAVVCMFVLSGTSCQKPLDPMDFAEPLQKADAVVLYEGLPHHLYEKDLLKEERETKEVVELHGYPFYKETLELKAKDEKRLTEILYDKSSYAVFEEEAKCGGFHPDYAVEWQVGSDSYHALLCFGCEEAKVFGPELEERYNLLVEDELEKLLKGYQKNRPEIDKSKW